MYLVRAGNLLCVLHEGKDFPAPPFPLAFLRFRLQIKRLKFLEGHIKLNIVMITHNNEIAQLADRIVRIEDGKIVG